jgi:dihydrodiol dehydrogenase / D-xylose 1-dehydrogenase (NADP)
MGGGSILDIGVYCLQLAMLVFGNKPPTQVRAAGTVSVGESVDESVGAVLLYEGGRMANITIHAIVTLPNEAVITGTKGSIKVSTKISFCLALSTSMSNFNMY